MEKIRERFEFWPSSAGSQRGPIPKPFPDIFQIDFVTNITWVDHNNNRNVRHGKDSKFPNETTIPGRLFYDWTNMRQRIDHGPGSYECTHFYEHDGPCSLIFLPDLGMYRILKDHDATTTHNKSTGMFSPSFECCLDIPNIGTPPPDWAQLGNPTYNGVVYDDVSNMYTYEWVYDNVTATDYSVFSGRRESSRASTRDNEHQEQEHRRTRGASGLKQQPTTSLSKSNAAEEFHTTRQTVFDKIYAGRPVLFTFPSASGRQDYHYLVETMQTLDKMDTSTFELPGACLQQFCKCRDTVSWSTTYR